MKTKNRRMPAEWEPQSAVQLTWPHEGTDWAPILSEITAVYEEMKREIEKREPVIIVDDIIDTAGTIVKAGQLLMDNGAKSVRAFATHAVCSGPAMERLDNSVFSEVVVTDSIPLRDNASKKIKVVSTASLFADVIRRVESYESISSLFK